MAARTTGDEAGDGARQVRIEDEGNGMKRKNHLALGTGAALIASLLVTVPSQASVSQTDGASTASAPAATVDLSPYDNAVLADQPTVYWPMASAGSGVEADLGLAGLSGSYTGDPATTRLPNGDSATVFDGATQYFEAADSDALSPTTTGEITIEAWIRPDTLQFANSQSSGYVNWMGKGEDQQHEYLGRMYSYDNTENRPNRISGYSFNTTGGLGAGSYFQDPVAVGEWIHFALVINTVDKDGLFPNGYTKVYKNGVLRDQDDLSIRGVTIVPERSSAPFRAGTRDFASWFQGAIGKIAVYDTELTPQQLAAHTAAMGVSAPASLSLTSKGEWVDRNGNGKVDGSDATEVQFTVSNTGYRTLTNVEVTSPVLGGTIDCGVVVLSPGAVVECDPVITKLTWSEIVLRRKLVIASVTAIDRTETVRSATWSIVEFPRWRKG